MSVKASVAVLFIGVFIWLLAGASVSSSVPENTAKGLGYTDIKVSGRSYALPFGKCGEDDIVKWDVMGTNPLGQHIAFTVCAGPFKGGTPRF